MSTRNYRLKFTPKAEEDFEEIYGYIINTLFAENAANRLIDKIEKEIMRLTEFPFSCSYVLDDPLKARGYRKLIVENYLVFYLVDEAEAQAQVVIMRVLYGASNYQNIL